MATPMNNFHVQKPSFRSVISSRNYFLSNSLIMLIMVILFASSALAQEAPQDNPVFDTGVSASSSDELIETDGPDALLHKKVPAADSLALVALFNSTDGANWTNNTNWLSGNPVETWFGVTVSSGSVIELNLGSNNLTGTIPAQIADMSALEVIDLSHNQLSGPIFGGISSMPSVVTLDLSHNQLSGGVGAFNGSNHPFRIIDLSHNQLSGILSSGIERGLNLEVLDLSHNMLAGASSVEFRPAALMRTLNLSHNQFSDNVPFDLLSGSSIETVDLSHNQFSRLSSVVFGSPGGNLRVLDLSDNLLQGAIPAEIEVLLESARMDVLDFSNNQFTGDVPAVLMNRGPLSLDLSGNQLSGLSAASITNGFTDLSIQDNLFTFEDIEPNIHVAGFTYVPQDSIGASSDITVLFGSNHTLSISTGGTANVYQWSKDGIDIPGATGASFTINGATLDDAGIYTVRVTNTIAPDLTLFGRPVNVAVDAGVTAADSLALVALFNSTNGTNWTNNTNWLSGSPAATWFGVAVSGGRVTQLNLSSNNLAGTIPGQVSDIASLQVLDLSHNQLTGFIPTSIGDLNSIVTLDLSHNQLTGLVLRAFTLQNHPVEVIDLSYNQLKGQLIEGHFLPPNLRVFDLSHNEIDSRLPERIPLGNQIEVFDISHNQFEGALDVFGESSLRTRLLFRIFDLSHNRFSSGIPIINLGLLGPIELIDLSYNQLSGPLPIGSGNFSKAIALNLSNNQLTGSLSPFDGSGITRTLDVSNNRFDDLPPQFNLPALSALHVQDNLFTFEDIEPNVGFSTFTYAPQDSIGTPVDTTISSGSGLTLSVSVGGTANLYQWSKDGIDIPGATGASFTINGATLVDEGKYTVRVTNTIAPDLTLFGRPVNVAVDAGVIAADSLALVALYNSTGGSSWTNNTNWLSGNPVATWFGVTVSAARRVTRLNLEANNLTGSLPPLLGNLKGVIEIDVSQNGISGAIPAELGGLPELKTLTLSDNQLSGGIPTDLGLLPVLGFLDLSNNQLNGAIPVNLRSISTLNQLDLSGNQLTGSIPAILGGMPVLTELNLSNNQLTGTIAEELTDFPALVTMNFSNNQLSGPVPGFIDGLFSLRTLDWSNNALTGSFPANLSSAPGLTTLDVSGNLIDDFPDVTSLASLSNLHVQNNLLTFEDIEHNISVPAFDYGFQDSIGTPVDTTISSGGSLTLSVFVGGTANVYQWSKDDIDIPGANAPSFTISSAALTDAGKYAVRVTNTIAPDLTLFSQPMDVMVEQPAIFADSLALVALFNSTDGANWTNNTNWLSASPVSSWFGVTVSGGRVSQLLLAQNNLAGTLPEELGDLASAIDLKLNDNQLSGAIPASLGGLSALKTLALQGNNLTGSIPSELGSLSNLIALNLFNNQLTGAIPSALGNLTKLDFLSFSSNQLTGEIPTEFGGLTKLREFFMTGNQLSGAVPASITNLPSIKSLSFADNNFDDIPDLSSLAPLVLLSIRDNNLTFEDIEPNVGAAASFVYTPQALIGTPLDTLLSPNSSLTLSVSVGGTANVYQWAKNGIDIPGANTAIFTLDSATFLDNGEYTVRVTNTIATALTLSSHPAKVTVTNPAVKADSLALISFYNSTNGPGWTNNVNWLSSLALSRWRGVFTSGPGTRVISLDLNTNKLTGPIPAEIGNLTDLEFMSLIQNSISGPLPSEIGNLVNLGFLHLFRNQFSGPIPASLGNLVNLSFLGLSENQFSGPIPAELGNLVNLSFLDLSENQFSGPIPAELGNLAKLRDLNFSDNGLSGLIPAELGNLAKLSDLNFSNNELSGSIPAELGNLSELARLNLFNNQLAGSIPPELGGLENLTFISLTANQLSGSIPDSLSNLVKLRDFFMARNQLTGSVPASITNLTDLRSASFADNDLEDFPDISSLTLVTSLFLQGNKFTFEDIEPNISIRVFNYAPQDSIGTPIDTTISTGSGLTLSVFVGGTANVYQWSKDDIDIPGANAASFTINSATLADAGQYAVRVTNTIAPDLTLFGHPANIAVEDVAVSQADSLALVKFFKSTRGTKWTNNTNWLSANPVSTWFGVSVVGGRVTKIELPSNNLSGYLSSEIRKLDGLTELRLPDNKIRWFIPRSIGSLSVLKVLDLSQNRFFGFMPKEIGDLTSLQELRLNNNILVGRLSSRIGNLTNLQLLDLSSNVLYGNIPSSLWTLGQLTELDLHRNYFYGSLSPDIGNLSSLVRLDLAKNLLSGGVPAELSNLAQLQEINLDRNRFTEFPDISALTGVSDLTVNDNKLTFEDIEPNVGVAASFVYSPQAKFGKKKKIRIAQGDSLKLEGVVAGTANIYQWKIDGTEIIGATSPQFTKVIDSESDFGTYTLHVTNTIATDLELVSNDIRVVRKGGWNKVSVAASIASPDNSAGTFSMTTLAIGDNLTAFVDFKEKDITNLPLSKSRLSDNTDDSGDLGIHYDAEIPVESANGMLTFDYTDMLSPDEDISDYLQSLDMTSVVIDEDNGTITLPVDGFPTWKRGGDVTVVEAEENPDADGIVPREFGLDQNYPNPFNPTTSIRYSVADAANVTLKIYNVLGQNVATLVNEARVPGTYTVVWNGRDDFGTQVSSGIYFYVLQTSTGFTAKRKMLLIK